MHSLAHATLKDDSNHAFNVSLRIYFFTLIRLNDFGAELTATLLSLVSALISALGSTMLRFFRPVSSDANMFSTFLKHEEVWHTQEVRLWRI
jgi:hypothetical protein